MLNSLNSIWNFHQCCLKIFSCGFMTNNIKCWWALLLLIRFLKEMMCTLLTGLLAMPLGVIQFLPLYHPLHDMFNIHTEVCVMLFLTIYMATAWIADRNPTSNARSSSPGTDNYRFFFVPLHRKYLVKRSICSNHSQLFKYCDCQRSLKHFSQADAF